MTRDSDQTEWLPVPDYEGFYEVSHLGEIRSLYFDPPRPVARGHDSNNYPVVMLSKDGRRTPKTIHRLVCRAFHGEPPNAIQKEAAHLNGDRSDARAKNLAWVGKRQNHAHKILHGTHQAGERHPRAKLTVSAVREIRRSPGVRAALAKKFGVSCSAIDDVRRGKNWRSVT